jgi:hypothetical protein
MWTISKMTSTISPAALQVSTVLPTKLGIAETDPAHPNNILYALASTQQQGRSDTKYDIPAAAIETFGSEQKQNSNYTRIFTTLGAFGAAAAIVGGLAVLFS